MSKQSLMETNALLFLNNYLHVAKRKTFNTELEAMDTHQMSFTERVILYGLLMEKEPFEEQVANETWSRLSWWLSELKEITDLNKFAAHISLSDFLAQELIAALERHRVFFKLKPQELAEKVKEQREFFTTYNVVLSLATIISPLRQKEFHYLEKKHTDFGDSHDYYLFTEGCIDLCLIQNAPKLVPLIENYLSVYLTLFQNPQTRWDENIFTWDKQRKIVQQILLERKEKFGNRFFLQPEELEAIQNEHGDSFRFVETLLVMQSLGELTVYCDCPNVRRGDTLCLSIELFAKEGVGTDSQQDEAKFFQFGNSITDCDTHYIWKDGDKANGQNLVKGKRRYIWQYCRVICDQGFQTQEALNQYVSGKLRPGEKVTNDDMKGLTALVARLSDVPLKELCTKYIVFKEGKGIEIKKVPL